MNSGLLVATLLFATIQPPPVADNITVYSYGNEAASVVATEERGCVDSNELDDVVEDTKVYGENNNCTHGVFIDIIEHDDYTEGVCECGETIRWVDYEDSEDSAEEDFIPDDDCIWVPDGDCLHCTVHDCIAFYYDESDDDGEIE